MADKTGYIGRNPGDSSVTIARQTFTPTSNTTEFTFTSGYTVGLCDVYLNGVKLVDTRDYEANTGSTVGLTSEAVSGDIVEIIAYKAFNLGQVSSSSGNFTVGANLSVGSTATLSGVTTCEGDLYVGGVIYGDGSNLTGVGGTNNINTNNIKVSGISTLGHATGTELKITGIVTASSGVKIPGGELQVGTAVTIGAAGVTTFSNGVHLDGSTTFGKGNAILLENGFENENAQIVNDGATEKATIVFKTSSGGTVSERLRIKDTGDVDLSGSAAGVSSVTWDASADSLIFKDKSYLKFGDSSDLSIYHDGSHSFISDGGTGSLKIGSDGLSIQIADYSETMAVFTPNAAVDLYYNDTKRLHTDGAGSYTTGIHTASQSLHAGTTITADGGTGIITATSYKGDGSALTGVGGEFDITSSLFI